MRLPLSLLLLAVSACTASGYHRQSASPFAEADWQVVPDVRFVGQHDEKDCGHAVLSMVWNRWHQAHPLKPLELPPVQPDKGLTARTMKATLEATGLRAFVISGTFDDLVHEVKHGRPVIVGSYEIKGEYAFGHYQVVAGVAHAGDAVMLIDPARGWHRLSFDKFDKLWKLGKRVAIVVMPPKPSAAGAEGPSTSTAEPPLGEPAGQASVPVVPPQS